MSKTLVQLIQEKTGISEEQAQGALNTVVGFLKEKLPEPIAGQIDGLVSGDVSGVADQISSLTAGLGGLFGKKE
ncbi:DUF2267 domain-containing protein [Oscillochloris sp. ZM17-4]|uniref:DUF2267 domain-containing protein n=1 Tax=Oscillochloris sp. ZM17-4 TaxID=2866714 RepID=UPI001C73BE85|nr:DUF2267 domain-containing protein [Oscillochloris sp. ZM17-4]MBX0327060.1 DUF2267 domain-containing protein [Oscillochloris sp. ZM17-4]